MSAEAREERLTELVLDWQELVSQGQAPEPATFCNERGCADLLDEFTKRIALIQQMEGLADHLCSEDGAPSPPPPVRRSAGRAGMELGPYQLVELLGEGGMGEVWRARQLRPVERDVALKLIKRGLATEDVLARFEAEKQALALMSHPHIAKVLDAGTTDHDQPYFVMEYVHGVPITRYCEENRLPLRARLEIFAAVCQAVQHAHQKGIIHRDLKPSNVLVEQVDGKPAPKVIDFGVAKATGSTQISEKTLTLAGLLVGTPAYMAPEQARYDANDIDTRVDVYALGVLLYELLTGLLPFETERLKKAGLDEVLRIIREEEPSRPSTKVTRTQKKPADAGQSVEALSRALRGDLDWIVMKCLEKERERRYESASALALDLQRYLADEPVTAGPDPWQRRLMRWRRRHPNLVTSLTVLVITLIFTTAIGGYLLGRREHRATTLARVESLSGANAATVPYLLEILSADPKIVQPVLEEKWKNRKLSPSQRLRIGLALANAPDVRHELVALARVANDPSEVLLVRAALEPFKHDLRPALWELVSTASPDSKERFHILAILAGVDSAATQWQTYAPELMDHFLRENPLHLGIWKEALEPIKLHLLPSLIAAFRTSVDPDRRRLAATLVADHAADLPDVLVDLLLDADENQYSVIFPKIQAKRDFALTALNLELDRTVGEVEPSSADTARDVLAKRQAKAAIALLGLGSPERVWSLLEHRPDPRLRSFLIHRFAALKVETAYLFERLENERSVSCKRALLLAIGTYSPNQLPKGRRKNLQERLFQWYSNDSDAGMHSAIEWLLRRWGNEELIVSVKRKLAKKASLPTSTFDHKKWSVDGQSQTLVLINGPIEFWMGSPVSESGRANHEPYRLVRIDHCYALADTPVTKEQFLRYKPKFWHSQMYRYPAPTCPIGGVTWHEAAGYCNWLSKEEGIEPKEWCYETGSDGEVIRLKPNHLQLTGYRLPTEVEWEYACRAGTVTSRYYGNADELLGEYGWYERNSQDRTWPVGEKKPNDFGLFDMHGNVWTWCQETYSEVTDEKPVAQLQLGQSQFAVEKDVYRPIRAGSFPNRARDLRSANRGKSVPADSGDNVGIRVCRTCR
jgi:serine/threonine protein kinase/formylglycine-generating enzyme required for sulfatase activity